MFGHSVKAEVGGMGTVHGGLVVVSKHALSPDVQQERIVSGLESVISFFQLAAAI